MIFKDFNEVFEVFKNFEDNVVSSNINNDCNVFINEEVLYIQAPAVGIEKDDVSIELNDNVLEIKSKIKNNWFKKAEDEAKTTNIKKGFKLGEVTAKVKLSQKYIDGNFEVEIENGLIQIKISPIEAKAKFKKIF